MLGMWPDAWDGIENLPSAERTRPAALAVRLVICTGLQRWEMGGEIVRLFSPGLPLDLREAAGRFYLSHAEYLCGVGDVQGAKDAVRALSFVWPEGRELALAASVLNLLW